MNARVRRSLACYFSIGGISLTGPRRSVTVTGSTQNLYFAFAKSCYEEAEDMAGYLIIVPAHSLMMDPVTKSF